MQFTKMNGAGNDFIILDNLDSMIPHSRFPEIARILCRRHLSVGADGLMVVEPARQGGSFRMLFFNADGSAGEMCGNGARCICRYGYEHGLAGEVQTIETPSGVVTGWRIDRRNYRIRLTDPSVVRLDCPVTSGGTGAAPRGRAISRTGGADYGPDAGAGPGAAVEQGVPQGGERGLL